MTSHSITLIHSLNTLFQYFQLSSSPKGQQRGDNIQILASKNYISLFVTHFYCYLRKAEDFHFKSTNTRALQHSNPLEKWSDLKDYKPSRNREWIDSRYVKKVELMRADTSVETGHRKRIPKCHWVHGWVSHSSLMKAQEKQIWTKKIMSQFIIKYISPVRKTSIFCSTLTKTNTVR